MFCNLKKKKEKKKGGGHVRKGRSKRDEMEELIKRRERKRLGMAAGYLPSATCFQTNHFLSGPQKNRFTNCHVEKKKKNSHPKNN